MITDISDSSEDSVMNWQVMNSSKRKKKTKTTRQTTDKKPKYDGPTTSNTNKFSIDGDENKSQDENGEKQTKDGTPKPPPIFIPCVDNISKMIICIASVISKNDFNYKSLRDGQIKILVKTVESYRKIIKHLDSKKICFHTYQLKNERAYRVVLKGLHHSTATEDIKAELILLGHQVRSVTNVKSQITKQALPMFFVDLDPSPENNKIYEIRYINSAVVKIEPQRKTNDIVQCHRCQEYGHTKSYCKKPFACVKCGMAHPTAECKKPKDAPPKCLHCLQTHTANYKGCQVYKSLRQKFDNTQRNNRQFINVTNSGQFPQSNYNYMNYQNNNLQTNPTNPTYSEVLKQNNKTQQIDTSALKNIENMFSQLMSMLSLLISKLCK